MNQNLRVRLRGEAVAAERQALAEVAIVVHLAVEDDRDVLGFVPDGLVAARHIDNAQSAHPQRESRGARISGQEALVIRPAMPHRSGHGANARFCLRRPRSKRDAADTAHATV